MLSVLLNHIYCIVTVKVVSSIIVARELYTSQINDASKSNSRVKTL